MNALGMIETRGILCTVEALDSMLKAAEVHLVNRTFVGGGIVTVMVEGDVAAVRAAVDAGAAAVQAISPESFLSEHVIPRPDPSIDSIVIPGSADDNPDDEGPDTDPDGGNGPDNEESGNKSAENIAAPAEDNPTEKDSTAGQAEDNSEKTAPEEAEKTETAAEGEQGNETEAEEKSDEPGSESSSGDDTGQSADQDKTDNTVPEKVPEARVSEPTADTRDDLGRVVAESGVDALDERLSSYRVSELRKLARGYKGFSLSGRDISKANKKMLIEAIKAYYSTTSFS